MNLTKEYEHELYNDEALISVVNVGYGYASPHDADEKEKAARKLGLNTVVQAGNYVKVLDLPSIILIVENEMNVIAFSIHCLYFIFFHTSCNNSLLSFISYPCFWSTSFSFYSSCLHLKKSEQ